MPGLTAKQEQFAKNVGIRNMGLAEAYRASGYSTDNMKDKVIRNRASELRQHSGVSVAIRGFQDATTREMTASVASDEDLVLTELRRVIKDGESDNVKVRAAEALGKTVPGLFKGEERTEPQRTPEEIRAELAELLATRGMRLVEVDKPDKAVH